MAATAKWRNQFVEMRAQEVCETHVMASEAPTVMFICDTCGVRKPLDKTKRHWGEHCGPSPIEMRCVRDCKPPSLAIFAADQ